MREHIPYAGPIEVGAEFVWQPGSPGGDRAFFLVVTRISSRGDESIVWARDQQRPDGPAFPNPEDHFRASCVSLASYQNGTWRKRADMRGRRRPAAPEDDEP